MGEEQRQHTTTHTQPTQDLGGSFLCLSKKKATTVTKAHVFFFLQVVDDRQRRDREFGRADGINHDTYPSLLQRGLGLWAIERSYVALPSEERRNRVTAVSVVAGEAPAGG